MANKSITYENHTYWIARAILAEIRHEDLREAYVRLRARISPDSPDAYKIHRAEMAVERAYAKAQDLRGKSRQAYGF